MLTKIELPESLTYRDSQAFFFEALKNGNKIDFLLGYFSTASFKLLCRGLALFIYRGGTMRLVINQFLSENDKNTLANAYNGDFPKDLVDLNDLDSLFKSLDQYGTHFFNCISYLISEGRIEIVIIKASKEGGVAHNKEGIVYDSEDNKIAFSGSVNFTANGLARNIESLDVAHSWVGAGFHDAKIAERIATFESHFKGTNPSSRHISIEEIEVVIRDKFDSKDANELIIDERELLDIERQIESNPSNKKILNELAAEYEFIAREPRFPFPEPRAYQKKAYEKWLANDKKGIFAMATGTGKTITSLNCLLNEYKETGYYKAVIVVPSIPLMNQWQNECRKFNFSREKIITISSKSKWEERLDNISLMMKKEQSFILIVSYAMLWQKRFLKKLKRLPRDVLFIADEAHNIGSKQVSKVLPEIHFANRIGLSATINRQFDNVGNDKINTFFNDSSPYIINYDMGQALDDGKLCPYQYYPVLVAMNEEEERQYEEFTRRLRRFQRQDGSYQDLPVVTILLNQRKNVIHRVSAKESAFKRILTDIFKSKGSLKYTLVYSPFGFHSSDQNTIDSTSESDTLSDAGEDQQRLITTYTKIISSIDNSVLVKKFTQDTGDRKQVLKDFETGRIHTLISMKCLDEGVDVPRAENAIFCSSSGNPRQFIQRRGRVLRNHRDKKIATVYDLIVIPHFSENDSSSWKKSIVHSEMKRVMDFAKLAKNRGEIIDNLWEIIKTFNIALN